MSTTSEAPTGARTAGVQTFEQVVEAHHGAELMAAGLTVAPSRDFDYLGELLRDPDVGGRTVNDDTPAFLPAHLEALKQLPGVLLLAVKRHGLPVGMFLLLPQEDPYTKQVHTLMGQACRGRYAWRAGRLGIEYMFHDTPVDRLVSQCPEDNPQSLVFAMCQGFHIVERRFDWRKNGRQMYSTHVELTRKTWEEQCRR